MKFSFFDLLPAISALLSFIILYLLLGWLWNVVNEFKAKTRRSQIIGQYSVASKGASRRLNKQLTTAQSVIGLYADQIVRNKYRQKLEQLLVNSGDWENRKYSNLVNRKIYFALIGFFVSFLLLLLNNPALIPAFLIIIFVSYILPDIEKLFHKATGSKYRKKLNTLLDQSGAWQENDYFVLVRKKIIFSMSSFVLSYLYLIAKDRSVSGFIFTILAVILGFFLPDILLQNKVLKRKEEIANSLPDAIDMLQMCVNAGLAFPAALSKVAETQSGPVSEEFARVTTEVQLGQSRSNALQAMAERTQEVNVQKFVGAMMQVDRFGIPIGNVLVEQSKEMRSSRRERAREKGQKVPVKILAPIMLCFLPSVLIIVLGPAVISIIGAL